MMEEFDRDYYHFWFRGYDIEDSCDKFFPLRITYAKWEFEQFMVIFHYFFRKDFENRFLPIFQEKEAREKNGENFEKSMQEEMYDMRDDFKLWLIIWYNVRRGYLRNNSSKLITELLVPDPEENEK